MENQLNHIFIRNSDQINNHVLIEFEYSFENSSSLYYSFLRPISESLEVLFNKMISKLYFSSNKRKNKKIKTEIPIDYCEIFALDIKNQNKICISDLTINDLLISNILIKINEVIYQIYFKPPWIKTCKLPKITMVNIPITPILDLENVNESELSINWYVSKCSSSDDWIKCHTGTIFIPSENYLNFFIKLQVNSTLTNKNQNFQLISTSPIQQYPQMEYQKLNLFNPILSDKTFRICSYNILSHIYAETDKAKSVLYRHCNPEFLTRDYRQCLIFGELLQHKSDIIFLQEVDQSFYQKSLYPILQSYNYEGIFQKKSRTNWEGQAIFWNINKFKLIDNISIPSLSKVINEENSEVYKKIKRFLRDTNLYNKWQSTGQCMTGCVLETVSLADRKRLMLCNNHLICDPKLEIFRLFQLAVGILQLEQIKYQYGEVCCVIGGDFNASFDAELMRFILDKSVECSLVNNAIKLNHSLGDFYSVFKDKIEFTNFTPDYVGVLDHIVIDCSGLEVKHLYDVPNRLDIAKNISLPNEFHPSDHLPLLCDISFK